jgi:recombination protein RecT
MPMQSEDEGKRFLRIAFTEIQKSPKLMACSPQSLFAAVAQSAVLGLEIGNALGHAYLVPYGNVATFLTGYKGLADLAYRSGKVSTIQSMVAREGEVFEWNPMEEPPIKHRPKGDPAARMTWVYTTYLAMSYAEVEAVKIRSRAKNDGPWVTDYEAMAMKTCLRRHLKLLPTSAMMQKAIAADERVDSGLVGDFDIGIDFPETPQAPPLHDNVDRDTGEIMAPNDRPTEGVSNPIVRATEIDQGACPEHDKAWSVGDQGGLYHFSGESTCTPSKILTAIAQDLGFTKADLDRQLREKYGNTASKLTGLETLAAYNVLVKARQGQTQEESVKAISVSDDAQVPLI